MDRPPSEEGVRTDVPRRYASRPRDIIRNCFCQRRRGAVPSAEAAPRLTPSAPWSRERRWIKGNPTLMPTRKLSDRWKNKELREAIASLESLQMSRRYWQRVKRRGIARIYKRYSGNGWPIFQPPIYGSAHVSNLW